MNIILLGPPGSGKGTQAEFICNHYNLTHLSTGDLFRDNIKQKTELGTKAKELIDKGEYVPDNITNSMVEDFMHQHDNVLFDGYPRTEPQAAALDKMLQEKGKYLDAVVFLDVPDDEVIKRIVLRGKQGSGRADDNEATARTRLKVYYDQTHVLVDHYRNSAKLLHINGAQSIEEVTKSIFAALDAV